jgi:hypothetical protein
VHTLDQTSFERSDHGGYNDGCMERALHQTCVKNVRRRHVLQHPAVEWRIIHTLNFSLKLRERKDVEWVNLVQDKYQSRADVNSVMNFRFPLKTIRVFVIVVRMEAITSLDGQERYLF